MIVRRKHLPSVSSWDITLHLGPEVFWLDLYKAYNKQYVILYAF